VMSKNDLGGLPAFLIPEGREKEIRYLF